MATFQGLFSLVFGAGLLWMNYQALRNGWLPCGSNGFKGRLEFKKDKQPVEFWFLSLRYGDGGLWLMVFFLQLLAGQAAPFPHR